MSTITKKQVIVMAVISASAILMAISPSVLNTNNFAVFAWNHHHWGWSHHHHHHWHHGWGGGGDGWGHGFDYFGGHHNFAHQGIHQDQESHQGAQCVSGDSTFGSCNNLNFQNEFNKGNNALAQR